MNELKPKGSPSMDILVAGLGNILFGDDGFGPEVIRRLSSRPLGSGVRIVDYGNRCFDLVVAMLEPLDAVILIDAVLGSEAPGTLHVMEFEPAPEEDDEATSLEIHSLEPRKLVRMARRLGCRARTVILVGCEVSAPAAGAPAGIGLSEPAQQAVAPAVREVELLIQQLLRPATPLCHRVSAEDNQDVAAHLQ